MLPGVGTAAHAAVRAPPVAMSFVTAREKTKLQVNTPQLRSPAPDITPPGDSEGVALAAPPPATLIVATSIATTIHLLRVKQLPRVIRMVRR